MHIWHQKVTLESVNQRSKDTMMAFLGIEFIEIGDDFMTATMPVSDRTKQPLGILHGGACEHCGQYGGGFFEVLLCRSRN